jgi:hypothetical protein
MGKRKHSEEDDLDGEVEQQEGWKWGVGAGTRWITHKKQQMVSEARSPCLASENFGISQYVILPREVVRLLGTCFQGK